MGRWSRMAQCASAHLGPDTDEMIVAKQRWRDAHHQQPGTPLMTRVSRRESTTPIDTAPAHFSPTLNEILRSVSIPSNWATIALASRRLDSQTYPNAIMEDQDLGLRFGSPSHGSSCGDQGQGFTIDDLFRIEFCQIEVYIAKTLIIHEDLEFVAIGNAWLIRHFEA